MTRTHTGKVRAGLALGGLAALAATDTAAGVFIRGLALELSQILAILVIFPLSWLGCVLGFSVPCLLWAIVDPAWWGENPWEARTFENRCGTRTQLPAIAAHGAGVLCAKLLGGALLLGIAAGGAAFCLAYGTPDLLADSGRSRGPGALLLQSAFLGAHITLLFFVPTAAIVGAILLVRELRHPGFRPVLRFVQHPRTVFVLFTLGMGRLLDVW